MNLYVGGEHKTYVVHQVVCAAFHGPRPSGHVVSHNDGVRSNCRADNLRWDTQSGNLADRNEHGTHGKGDRSYSAKLTWEQVREIRASTESAKVLAERYGVFWSGIYKIRRGEKWVE